MRTNPRPGIARARSSAAAAAAAAIDLETVGFVLAPRLNAAGRVGEALDAARLLLAETPEQAAELAATLETANTTRRDLMRTAIAEARAAFGMPDPGAGAGPAGAARTCPTVDAPAIAVARRAGRRRRCSSAGRGRSGSSGSSRAASPTRPAARPSSGRRSATSIRASCRSDGRVNLAEALDRVRGPVHPVRRPCGGGRLRAPGRALGRVHGALPRGGRRERARRTPARRSRSTWPSRRRMSTTALYRDLARLAPCGTGNPEPLVAVLGPHRPARPRLANGGHTQLVLRRERDVLDGIAFGRAGPRGVRSRKGIASTSSRGSRAGCSAGWRRSSWRSATCRRRARTRAPPRSSTAPPAAWPATPVGPGRARAGPGRRRMTARPQPAQRRRAPRRPARTRGLLPAACRSRRSSRSSACS